MTKKPEKIIDIPVVNYHPELVAIDEKIQTSKDLLKSENLELTKFSSPVGFGQHVGKIDSTKDGMFLASGGDINSLSGTLPESKRLDTIRRIHALEQCIKILENQRRELFPKLVREACKELPDTVVQPYRDILDTAEQLISKINKAVEVSEFLSGKGFQQEYRPIHLQVNPYWLRLLNGDHIAGLQSINFMLDVLKKAWEI